MISYTNDITEWNEDRFSRYGHPIKHGPEAAVVCLPLPHNFKCKGYTFVPVVREEDGTMLECKSKVLQDNESLMDYDFSNCYVHDYLLVFGETPMVGEDFEPVLDKGYNVTVGRKIRFAGEAVKK